MWDAVSVDDEHQHDAPHTWDPKFDKKFQQQIPKSLPDSLYPIWLCAFQKCFPIPYKASSTTQPHTLLNLTLWNTTRLLLFLTGDSLVPSVAFHVTAGQISTHLKSETIACGQTIADSKITSILPNHVLPLLPPISFYGRGSVSKLSNSCLKTVQWFPLDHHFSWIIPLPHQPATPGQPLLLVRHCYVAWCALDHDENYNRRNWAVWWFCQRKKCSRSKIFQCYSKDSTSITSDRMRGKGLTRAGWGWILGNVCLERVVMLWNRLPREVWGSSSLEVLKEKADVVLRKMV